MSTVEVLSSTALAAEAICLYGCGLDRARSIVAEEQRADVHGHVTKRRRRSERLRPRMACDHATREMLHTESRARSRTDPPNQLPHSYRAGEEPVDSLFTENLLQIEARESARDQSYRANRLVCFLQSAARTRVPPGAAQLFAAHGCYAATPNASVPVTRDVDAGLILVIAPFSLEVVPHDCTSCHCLPSRPRCGSIPRGARTRKPSTVAVAYKPRYAAAQATPNKSGCGPPHQLSIPVRKPGKFEPNRPSAPHARRSGLPRSSAHLQPSPIPRLVTCKYRCVSDAACPSID